MRSFDFIRNIIVLCVYTIYQLVDEYPFYGEIGIAVAVTVIQRIIDLNISTIFQINSIPQSLGKLTAIG